MKALRLTGWKQPPEFLEVPDPEAGPAEVIIRVGAAGACHSDLHLMEEFDTGMVPFEPPFTLGHENAGWIESLGAGVTGFEVGQEVAVYGPWGCGHCRRCRLGMENYRENQLGLSVMGGGLGADGGMTPRMRVPNARLAVDVREDALDLADKVGAHHHVLAGPDAVKEIRYATQGKGADLVLDFVGSDTSLALGVSVGRQMGHLTVVELAGGTLPFSFFAVPYELSLATTYWGTLPELMEVIELAKAGHLSAQVHRYPLDQALDAYRELKEGRIEGRAIIVPQ